MALKLFFSKKIFEKSEYLVRILVKISFYFKAASCMGLLIVIWGIYKEWIIISEASRADTYTTKVSDLSFNIILANFSLLISSIHLIISRALMVVQNLQVCFHSKNDMSALLMVKKNVISTNFTLVLANKKVF